MVGIERVYGRIRQYSGVSRMRVNAVLTAAAEILVRAIVDEVNRNFQKLGHRLDRLEERLVQNQQRIDRLEGTNAKPT